jgi:predicted alpha-1,2-mannosidase
MIADFFRLPGFFPFKLTFPALLFCLLMNYNANAQQSSAVNYAGLVNTTLGTKGKGHGVQEQYLEAGYTFPGAMVPFGMVQFTPTFFAENKGFVVNQLSGAGCEHMGNFPVMPIAGAMIKSPNDMKSFHPDYKIGKAVAGLYEVKLVAEDITCALTVTPRTGMATFRYNEAEKTGTVVIGSGINATKISEAHVTITGSNSCEGYADGGSFCGSQTPYKIYFVAQFDKQAVQSGTWKDNTVKTGSKEDSGENSGAWFSFDVSKVKSIGYKFGISYVSLANARENLAAENPGWDFNLVKNNAQQAWNKYLGKIKVIGGSTDHIAQFYSNLYHAFGHPNIANDINGEYQGADLKVHTIKSGNYYTSFSNWDTYRTQIQLISMLAPKETSQMVGSMITFAQQSGGSFPRWVLASSETGIMQGDPTSIVVANAYAFGVRQFDLAAALKVMRRGAEIPGAKSQGIETRPFLDQYLKKGYVDDASMSLEYNSADFAIGQFALQALKNKQIYDRYMKRASTWKNLYDPQTKWLRSKNPAGDWRGQNDGMREASYKSYYWMTSYNIKALTETIGGNKDAENRLDDFFRKLNANYADDWFAAGNEPDFQVPWIYNWIGAPYKTQALVKRIINEQYSNRGNGLPGNDDLGAMGAFYVFSNIGLFPVIPGIGGFSVNTPSFESIEITLPAGKKLKITGGSEKNDYTTKLRLNGKVRGGTWLSWQQLKEGGHLQFTSSSSPDRKWGTNIVPPSFR